MFQVSLAEISDFVVIAILRYYFEDQVLTAKQKELNRIA